MTRESGLGKPRSPTCRVGVGLRPPHYRAVLEEETSVDFVEVITENFLALDGAPRRVLRKVVKKLPVVLHGVGLNLLGHAGLDERYLEELVRLADEVDAAYVTDHLCWTGALGMTHHDLLPVPFTRDLVGFAAERASMVQRRLGRPFGLENLSSYVEFTASELAEWEFYAQVVKSAGCFFMLDVNNLFVSSQNHGFDPEEYLQAIDYTRVLQVHLAGHEQTSNDGLIDTHDRPVCDAVWGLYQRVLKLGGALPTLIEWDDKIPPLKELEAEAERARALSTISLERAV